MTTTLDYSIRTARPTDAGYVCSTWVKSQYERGDIVDRVLDRKAARVLIAYPASDSDRILAWLCYERQPRAMLVHMAYARPKYRGHGLVRRMLTEARAGRESPYVLTAARTPDWCTWAKLPIKELLG